MDQYLRPNTLFNPTNFENYFNTKAETINKAAEQKKGINITKFDV